jgi:protein-L-isoaspartate(D-aspartate) O-methyltransferase
VSEHDFVREAVGAGVRDARVLEALRHVSRAQFVPQGSPSRRVDLDAPVPLPCGQTTSQPSLIGLMLEALELQPDDRVLEVGTGYGFEAALLGGLVAEVWTVEWWPELARRAAENLAAVGADNVHVVTGDGRLGLPEHAPYDAVVVAAQCDEVPQALGRQVRVGGRIVAPVGAAGRERCLLLAKQTDGSLRQVRDLGAVRFVPLLDD